MFNVRESFKKHSEKMKSSKVQDPKVCAKVVKEMASADPVLFDKVNALASETRFNVRRYGAGDFYCYPIHKALKDSSPWPANRYPKNSLLVAFALELSSQ